MCGLLIANPPLKCTEIIISLMKLIVKHLTSFVWIKSMSQKQSLFWKVFMSCCDEVVYTRSSLKWVCEASSAIKTLGLGEIYEKLQVEQKLQIVTNSKNSDVER